MTEIVTDPDIPDVPTENNNLLNPSTRNRNTSTQSTSTNGHQQVHTDEEDTDHESDMDIGDGSEYNTYTMDPTEAANITKSKHRKKDGKKFQSLTSQSQYPQKQKRNWLYALLILLCIILATGAVIYAYFYLTKKDPTPPPERPFIVVPTVSPTLEPTIIPSYIPSSDPTVLPTYYPTVIPSEYPTSIPSEQPTIEPTNIPSTIPTIEPTNIPSMIPTNIPSNIPSISPTNVPTSGPSDIPSASPTSNPSIQPSIHPSIFPSNNPSVAPSNMPSSAPTNNPSQGPSRDPSIAPTIKPSSNPTKQPSVIPTPSPSNNPSNVPTTDPSRSPSIDPTASPSNIPSVEPTQSPSLQPSVSPSNEPSVSPSKSPSANPSVPPTKAPSNNPSVTPTLQPTPSPTARILQIGNTVVEGGITMNFPENAFPDSDLTIIWGEASANTKAIFDDTTSAFQAVSITDLTQNAIHFIVENPPLSTPDIVYNTIIPIPAELLNTSICPNDYGYEIFTQMTQTGFGNEIFPVFVLFESFYDPNSNTLTTDLFPEMFTANPNGDGSVVADIVMSCTPGVNIIPVRRRLLFELQTLYSLRRLLQTNDFSNCKATPVLCPLQSKFCEKSKAYGRDHYGVDFKAANENVIAAADGVIERSETSQTYGEVIIIRHDDGSATLYGKLQSRSPVAVLDAVVTQGTVIGVTDDSHLHFEYIPNGRIYATKKRIDVSDCIPSNPLPTPQPTVPGQTLPPTQPTLQPSKSPLIPPSTHPPTAEPSVSPTSAPTPLPSGSITVRDSGRLADDSFAVWIDDVFRVCETEIGALNTCAISFLRPGVHTLTLEVLIAPDGFGTFNVQLSDGWTFSDGTTSKDAIDDYENFTPPAGHKETWEFIVPPATANNNAAVLGP